MERTLLLVDDEENIISALARQLREDGYTILRAGSGRQGLELLADHKVGVIISDQRMPEMTGVEFLGKVKGLYPKTVRMVLSGYADLESVKEAINRGAIYKFITKPWDEETLRAVVREAFEHHDLMQKKEQLALEIQSANAAMADISLDLSRLVAQQNTQIERISRYDPLTGLPNRLSFLDRLDQELAHALRDNRMVAVMFVDLDRFQQINDSFGHPAADRLLHAVAERLKSCVRASDTVARMGGDEFAFVLADIKDAKDAGEIARKILDSLARDPVTVGDNEIFVAASIGISLYPSDGQDSIALIKNADAALYYAKNEGRNNYQYYAAQMNASARQRLTLETELRRALEREEFVLHYQPKVNLASGKISGVEALLRWQSAEHGLVPPGEFITLLEETGLILPVGEWVLRTVCEQARAWKQAGFPATRIAVNLSAMQFRQPDLAGAILEILRRSDLDFCTGSLELELTESMLMRNVDRAITTLGRLREMGVHISIDDFGTGYSSLSYLKRFPINSLKIDQSFVRDISGGSNDRAIVGAIIALGHSLGLQVTAEGVETVEQLDYLRKARCDEMQGYLFSRPVPAEEIARLLQDGKSLDALGEA
ncbi:MAG: EAL domain-containing protein [Nitrosomonadales bacterium]|nr:EAL domain-containing protein [Nitrosomonadales bacterium]